MFLEKIISLETEENRTHADYCKKDKLSIEVHHLSLNLNGLIYVYI